MEWINRWVEVRKIMWWGLILVLVKCVCVDDFLILCIVSEVKGYWFMLMVDLCFLGLGSFFFLMWNSKMNVIVVLWYEEFVGRF